MTKHDDDDDYYYCLCAIEIPRYKIKEIGVCWNDSLRKCLVITVGSP